MSKIQAIRGFNDVLPDKTAGWQYLEQQLRQLAQQYAYAEIRSPVVEKTELFVRGVGEVTDIVEKEMYHFTDRNGDSLCLRPELTAGCVRAVVEHGLLHHQINRLWYLGPAFRHERPQAGRYRQFYQAGFEVFGIADVYLDAELILLSARLWRKLGLLEHLTLQINTLGTPAARNTHRQILIDYFVAHENQLDEESKRRLYKNPLRILDSKNPAMAELIASAPRLMDYLDADSIAYFDCLQAILRQNHIVFEVNDHLVRGLDYYCHGVFEWCSDQLGAQATICAGGRYDGLVAQLGGPPTPAVGFALGLERVLLLLEQNQCLPVEKTIWIYLISVSAEAKANALQLAELLHDQFVSAKMVNDTSVTSFKTQMKRADKSGALLALIIGEDELKTDTITVKFLREAIPQKTVARMNIIEFLKGFYGT